MKTSDSIKYQLSKAWHKVGDTATKALEEAQSAVLEATKMPSTPNYMVPSAMSKSDRSVDFAAKTPANSERSGMTVSETASESSSIASSGKVYALRAVSQASSARSEVPSTISEGEEPSLSASKGLQDPSGELADSESQRASCALLKTTTSEEGEESAALTTTTSKSEEEEEEEVPEEPPKAPPLPPTKVTSSARGGTEMWIQDPEASGCLPNSLLNRSTATTASYRLDNEIQNVTLRLLGGKNLPAEEDARLTIYLNDFLLVASLSMQEANPTWGGPLYKFFLEADVHQDELTFDWSAYGLSGKVRVPMAQLMACTERPSRPSAAKRAKINHWIKLSAGGDAHIQLRLSPTLGDPELHAQETSPTLTAGPAVPEELKSSYMIRKHILYGKGTPVLLHVYDCSNNSTVAYANEYLKSMGHGGIYHVGIEVHGREFSFGGSRDESYQGTGIFTNPPKECTRHHYRESVYLGDCELTKTQLALLVLQLELDWKAKSYNLFRHNCCCFCQVLARELGVGAIPEWVYALAEKTEGWEPTMIKVNQYLMERQEVRQQDAAASDDAMLDHAMAAKIQRNYRRRQSIGRSSVSR